MRTMLDDSFAQACEFSFLLEVTFDLFFLLLLSQKNDELISIHSRKKYNSANFISQSKSVLGLKSFCFCSKGIFTRYYKKSEREIRKKSSKKCINIT